jgi:nicotinamidase-related amidase
MGSKALLVIDVQYGFMKAGADVVVPRISQLTKTWPAEDVYYLKYRNYPNSFFAKHLDWTDCMTGDDVNIVKEVYLEGRPVFEHFGYMPPSELFAALRKYEVVNICGVDTDACVMAAVFALWDAEIKPMVLEYYCASSGEENMHKAALGLMLRQFGVTAVSRTQF